MLYVETSSAAFMYDVNERTLQLSAQRNSPKYPFIRIGEAGCRSRGGVKLLFKVNLEQIQTAIKNKKITPNAKIYLPDSQGGYEIVKLDALMQGGHRLGEILLHKPQEPTQPALAPQALIKASEKKQTQALIKERIVRAWQGAKKQGQDAASFCLLLESTAMLMAKAGKKTSKALGLAKAGKETTLNTQSDQEPNEAKVHSTLWASEIFSGLDMAIVGELLAKGLKPSRLYDWVRRFKSGGIDGLIDVRSSNKKCQIDRLGLNELLITQIQAQRGKINVANIHKALNFELASRVLDLAGKDPATDPLQIGYTPFSTADFLAGRAEGISYEIVNRAVRKYLSKNKIVEQLIKYGEDGVISRCLPAVGASNWAAGSINQIVEIDASPLDIICDASDICTRIGYANVKDVFASEAEFREFVSTWQKRYTLISIIDTYSRVCIMQLSESENSVAVARAIAKYILAYGKPAVIKGDNGRAFKSAHIAGLCARLGIEYRAVRAYSGYLKPYVERNFGTFQNAFSEQMAGFIGHSISQRQAVEFWFSREQRRLKRGQKTHLKSLHTFDEMQKLIDLYVAKILNNTRNTSLGATPAEIYNQKANEAVAMSALELSLAMAKASTKKVQKYGVMMEGICYANALMWEYERIKVRLNLDNAAECFVFDENDEFICVAGATEKTSYENVELSKQARQVVRKKLKATKQTMEDNQRLAQERFVRVIENADLASIKKPELKEINKELESAVAKDRAAAKNALLSDEALALAGAKESKQNKIKGFFEIAQEVG